MSSTNTNTNTSSTAGNQSGQSVQANAGVAKPAAVIPSGQTATLAQRQNIGDNCKASTTNSSYISAADKERINKANDW